MEWSTQIFVFVLLCKTNAGIGFIISPRETNSCIERGTPGLICQNCELMATCVRVGRSWLIVPVENCDIENRFYCNLQEGGCSNRTGPCHPFGFEGNFACTSEGVFPDPYDCQKYHMCYQASSTLVSANIDCGGNKAYSVKTGECSLVTSDPICTSKQYECYNAGDSRPWPGNANIFYICKAMVDGGTKVLYPTMYRCASGEKFNGTECVLNESVTDDNINTKRTTETNGKVTNTTNKLNCDGYGPGLQPNPIDCYSYLLCSTKGILNYHTCPPNTYFNKVMRACTFGSC